MKIAYFLLACLFAINGFSQKKPLDHTVYDSWQSIAEKAISHDGKYVAFAIVPQEGDGTLYIQSVSGDYKKEIARGYVPVITEDSRYLVCRIKPSFKETRDARIKKKRPDDMPKDSLVILELGKDAYTKVPRLKSFKVPDNSGNWLAYLLDKPLPEMNRQEPDSANRMNAMLGYADSLMHVADSIRNKATEIKEKGFAATRRPARQAPPVVPRVAEDLIEEGTELVLKNLQTGEEQKFKWVSEFFFNINGTSLVMETTRKIGDPSIRASVLKIDLASKKSTTVFKNFNDARGYRMDENGQQLAFVAERDSSSKSLQKFYKLYYYKEGADSAVLLADKFVKGMPANWTISENAQMSFSKSGKRLFAGTAPILPVKDTLTPEFDRVSVDIWHYNDDRIQPVQLKNLEIDLRKNYLANVQTETKQLMQIGNESFRNVLLTNEGDGAIFYAASDAGKRIAAQWQGFTLNDLYAIDAATGSSSIIKKDIKGNLLSASYSGKYLLYFDEKLSSYFVYDAEAKTTKSIAKDINFSLADELNDVPDDPNPYGIFKWIEKDRYVLIYDRYDVWKVDPSGVEKSLCLTNGRKDKIQYRLVSTDNDEKFLKADQKILCRLFDEKDKSAGLGYLSLLQNGDFNLLFKEAVSLSAANSIDKAKHADVLLYSKESYVKSPDLYVHPINGSATQLSHTNKQQASYNWGTAEIFKWKAFTGKETEGVLYKPEDFDPNKKYPMIVYFYERNNQTLHNYIAPAPTRSNLNISFFVSRGYIVFVPDIWYKIGYPGLSGYNYILSGTRAVVSKGYVDSTKIGLQGQSWGGYQIAYLINKTNLYAAAWAGAPVVNMFSAYGGIRWESGVNRQFQYEHTQSRIGGSLWEKTELYKENSPLFTLPAVKTPLVIMNNDADGAVPWYQGIEYYTAMRRLNKKIWLLNYNGEGHGLVERKNKKDISIREQQFFDYLLKGEKPAKWISEGLPAVLKGRDMGLGY